jgi:predicted permease
VFACTVLLLWAALFTRSLGNASAVDPGFRTDGVLVVDVTPPEPTAATPESVTATFERLQERVAALPGVAGSGMAWAVPLGFTSREEYDIRLPDTPDRANRRVLSNDVSPGFFSCVDIQLLAGRDVSATDTAAAPRVVLVNQTAARRLWSNEAVGRRIQMPDHDEWVDATVVGVVADSKYWTIGEEVQPTVYPALAQRLPRGANLFVRTGTPTQTAAALRQELGQLLHGMPVEVRRLEDAVKVSLMPARVGAAATAAIGCTALVLATVGIYALVAFSVAQRSREIGIRRAVGASGRDIARLIVGGSLLRVSAGLVPGLAVGGLGAAAFAAFIVGISPFDAATLASIATMILLVATIASAVPAYRATKVDPLVVLKTGN